MWFEALTGFREDQADDVAAQFEVAGEHLTSLANGRTMRHGSFETPTVADLRDRWNLGISGPLRDNRVQELVADAQDLHVDDAAAGAVFQVASQFNTLEMASPSVTPEDGIDQYETDHTQGPACAVACGAGTIFRNYLVPMPGRVGQSSTQQIDCLVDLGAALGVQIDMRNGYATPTLGELDTVNARLRDADEPARDELMAHLRVGLQWNTEVTLADAGHTVSQVYCSALPVADVPHPPEAWEPLARLVLDAAYEATLGAAVLNASATGNRTVYLTLVGGGVFGNSLSWILDALQRALRLFSNADLDVAIVSHSRPNPHLNGLLDPARSWVDDVFAPLPQQWGLRGDPLLWQELADAARSTSRPPTRDAFERLLGREWARLCGTDLTSTDTERLAVRRYPRAGMSGGFVSPPAWRDRLVPLLLHRLPG